MSNGFNDLEVAILEWLKRKYDHAQLSAQIDSAKLVIREWTKVGFFVYLEVSKDLASINLDELGGAWPIDGPQLTSKDIEHGGGVVIWGKDGYLDCVEMFAYGSFFNETVSAFELSS